MAKIKNPFKKSSITDTVVNIGIGGAGNVAFDYLWDVAGLDTTLASDDGKRDVSLIKNAIKLVGGAVAGSMVSNKYLRAMADGFGVVGASDLVSGLLNSTDLTNTSTSTSTGTEGLPAGTIGRMPRYGSRAYRRAAKSSRVAGLQDFMGE